MPTLNWIGKEKVVNHHQDVPYRILEHKYGFSAEFGKQENPTNSGNKIIHGDNLEALKSLMPEYEGKIKCIYIDPPYNTGNENWVYNDNVNHPKIKKWLGEVVGKQGEDLTRHDKWLCMMYPRLVLLHKLLCDNGAIFISIDDNEQASLKLMMDEIFGGGNFIGNFVWHKKYGGGGDNKNVVTEHEYILTYSKKNSAIFEILNGIELKEQEIKGYLKDEEGRYYKATDTILMRGPNSTNEKRPNLCYEIITPDNTVITPRNGKGTWCYERKTLNIKLEKKDLIWKKVKGSWMLYKKQYLFTDENKQRVKKARSILDKRYNIGQSGDGSMLLDNIFDEKRIFQNPKPISIIEFLLKLVCDQNSTILDSFAGSGTTAHAVLNLNKEDSGNRKFILIEMEDYAETTTAERVKRVIKGYGESQNAVDGTGGSFDFYQLGLPIFKNDKNLNEDVGEQKIREYIYFTETKQYLQREQTKQHHYLLDTYNDTGYYFYYEKENVTVLNSETLQIVTEKASQYLIYADVCSLDSEYMMRNNIIFKKIPRDIKRI